MSTPDVAKLRKVVDHSLELQEFQQRFDAFRAGETEVWYQGDWFRAYIEKPDYLGAPGYTEITRTDPFSVREALSIAEITDHGVVLTDKQGVEHQCKTAACIAGNTLLMFAPVGTKIRDQFAILPGQGLRRKQRISEWAKAELGLTGEWEHYGDSLFDGGNSADDIREIADNIITMVENGEVPDNIITMVENGEVPDNRDW